MVVLGALTYAVAAALVIQHSCAVELKFEYFLYDNLTAYLHSVAEEYPDITHLYSIGQTVEGRELWVMEIGENVGDNELMRPNVKYIGNMHGNEVLSRELMLHLIQYLTTGYEDNEDIRKLLQMTYVHILPSMNADGFENATLDGMEGECYGIQGRANMNGFDLNRNFPGYFEENPAPLQPETKAIISWVKEKQFLVSANLHGGAFLVNYPYDNYKAVNKSSRYVYSADDKEFITLSLAYSRAHSSMHLGEGCIYMDPDTNETIHYYDFPDGITNGAYWYPVLGGMQDYNYEHAGCMELTLEVGCCKYPPASQLEQLWLDNREALMALLMEGTKGVKGVVSNYHTGLPIQGAQVEIIGRDHPTKTTARGEFWRYLMPSKYYIKVTAGAYKTFEGHFVVTAGNATIYMVELVKGRDPSECVNAGKRTNVISAAALMITALFNVVHLYTLQLHVKLI